MAPVLATSTTSPAPSELGAAAVTWIEVSLELSMLVTETPASVTEVMLLPPPSRPVP